MIKQLNRYTTIFEGFDLWKGIPLDKRLLISSIDNVNTELPLNHRYYGILFFAKKEKTFYTFENDLQTIVKIFSIDNLADSNYLYEENYTLIGDKLNAIQETGKLITVLPLGVVFRFDGTKWVYVAGEYNFRTNIDLNNINQELKHISAPVRLNGESGKVFDGQYSVVDKFTNINNNNKSLLTTPNLPTNFEGRNLIERESIYSYINGKYFKTGTLNKQYPNTTLSIGVNKILEIPRQENIKPPYIKSIFWIKNYISKNINKQYLIPIEMQVVYDENETNNTWNVYVISEISTVGDLEIQYI